MRDIPHVEAKAGHTIDAWVGLCVVILATFLGVVNVKDNNIVQKMQLTQAERIDNWNWYQARKIRATIYDAFAEDLSIPWPNETPEVTRLREEKSASFHKRAMEQELESDKQFKAAKKAEEDYNTLNSKDDQFDLCEAALAIALALMGVTAIIKRWWLFAVAMVPAAFGVVMGVAGFMGFDTSSPAINWIVKVLS